MTYSIFVIRSTSKAPLSTTVNSLLLLTSLRVKYKNSNNYNNYIVFHFNFAMALLYMKAHQRALRRENNNGKTTTSNFRKD